jgi:hypothetical protein
VRYVECCEGKGAITLLLLMRDEKAVCSRLEDAHVFASMTRLLEGLMPCDLLGLGCDLGLGLGGLFLCIQDLCVQNRVGVMCYLVLSVRKPTPNPFCDDVLI